MTIVTASEARQTLPAQIDRVEKGEEVAITRHGKVVAILVSPQSLRRQRATRAWDAADAIGQMLDEARHRPISTGGMSSERADELVEEIRAGRAAR
ncbi:MAG: type II toxin-antitoxin system Phd/YefM family antitoxin [Microbacterium sp.]